MKKILALAAAAMLLLCTACGKSADPLSAYDAQKDKSPDMAAIVSQAIENIGEADAASYGEKLEAEVARILESGDFDTAPGGDLEEQLARVLAENMERDGTVSAPWGDIG